MVIDHPSDPVFEKLRETLERLPRTVNPRTKAQMLKQLDASRAKAFEYFRRATDRSPDILSGHFDVEKNAHSAIRSTRRDEQFSIGEPANDISSDVPISTEPTADHKKLDGRLALLDLFAKEHPGEPISAYATTLFPELFVLTGKGGFEGCQRLLPLPKRPPERWPTNPDKRSENPAEFATRVYRPWMDIGVISRADIKRLDPKLYVALNNFVARAKLPDDLPEGFNLPTLSEMNDRWVERVRKGEATLPDDPRELARFAVALGRRDPTSRNRD